jgi:hypothetical protein
MRQKVTALHVRIGKSSRATGHGVSQGYEFQAIFHWTILSYMTLCHQHQN